MITQVDAVRCGCHIRRLDVPTGRTIQQIPLLAGEPCPQEAATPSAVVNRRFAALYVPGVTPVGRHVEHSNPFLPASRIVGVVADAREEGLYGVFQESAAMPRATQ